jgi:shikimate kinase
VKTSIALIGFMGTGKTSVGKTLARRLDKKFFELDLLIEKKAGESIPKIFRDSGEIFFREMEIEAVKEVSGEKNAVIACGGGVVLNKINIDRLKSEAVIVYLTASPRIILNRTKSGSEERPLLNTENPALTIKEMTKFRRPFYERAADITVNTTGLDIDSVADQIIDKIKNYEGNYWEK